MRESERKKMDRYSDPKYGLKWLNEIFELYGESVLNFRERDVFRRYFMTDETAISIARSYNREPSTIFRVIWLSRRKLIRWIAECNRACKNTKWYDVTNDKGA